VNPLRSMAAVIDRREGTDGTTVSEFRQWSFIATTLDCTARGV